MKTHLLSIISFTLVLIHGALLGQASDGRSRLVNFLAEKGQSSTADPAIHSLADRLIEQFGVEQFEEPVFKPMDKDSTRMVREALKLNEADPVWQRFLHEFHRTKGEIDFVSNSLPPKVVLYRHLRNNSGGVPLPTEEEIGEQQEAIERETSEFYQNRPEFEQFTEQLIQKEQEQLTAPPQAATHLSACSTDLTKMINTESGRFENVPARAETYVDYLFIDADKKLPLDVKWFGEHTKIIPYSSKPGDYLSLAAEKLGLSCLPYRIRITEKHALHSLGTDALKNFDEKPQGVIHEEVKRRLLELRY